MKVDEALEPQLKGQSNTPARIPHTEYNHVAMPAAGHYEFAYQPTVNNGNPCGDFSIFAGEGTVQQQKFTTPVWNTENALTNMPAWNNENAPANTPT